MSGAHAQESATSPGDTVVELESLSAEGFAATVDAGNIEQEGDGSLTIENEHGEHIGALDTQITLGDGETRTIEYEVSGGSFEATYNSPNTDAQVENFVLDPSEASEGENGAQVQSRSVECGLSVAAAGGAFLGGVGAAMTAPLTAGGSLVVAGAAVTSGTANVNAAYQCYA